MIELGRVQTLKVVKETDFGVYLGTNEERVLLPIKQVAPGTQIGDAITVFIYKDSSDRLIATTTTPKIQLGQLARLRVAEVNYVGAFMEWGLERHVLLPFREQTVEVKAGDEYLVALYIDKSGRLAVTMRVIQYLGIAQDYEVDSAVTGSVVAIKPDHGIYVAVDDCYYGFITRNDMSSDIKIGDIIHGRVTKVREDGKLTISIRQKAYIQMDADSAAIYKALTDNGGRLPFNDKASPEIIKKEFNISKNAFKRAVGRLLKEGKIEILEDSICLKR